MVQSASILQPEFKTRLKQAGILSQYNQTYRYPGDPTEDFNPTPGELKKAFRIARDVYTSVIEAMPPEITGQQQRQPPQPTQQQRDQSEELEL